MSLSLECAPVPLPGGRLGAFPEPLRYLIASHFSVILGHDASSVALCVEQRDYKPREYKNWAVCQYFPPSYEPCFAAAFCAPPQCFACLWTAKDTAPSRSLLSLGVSIIFLALNPGEILCCCFSFTQRKLPKAEPCSWTSSLWKEGGNSSEGSLWQSEFSISLRSLGFSQASLTHSEVLSSQFGFAVQALSHLAVAEFTIKGTKGFFIKKSLMRELNWIAAPSSAGTVTGGCSKV